MLGSSRLETRHRPEREFPSAGITYTSPSARGAVHVWAVSTRVGDWCRPLSGTFLIVRDQAHENAFAKALESLGVNWGAALPIPKTNAEQFPEVKKLVDMGLQSIQYTFSADDESQAAKLYRGASPSNDGTELSTAVMPEGFPMTIAPERREEFAPGLDKELLALIQATAEVEIKANGQA